MLKVILLRPWWVPNSPHLKAWGPDPSFMSCVLNAKNGPTGNYLLVTFHLVFPGADFVTKVRSQWSQIRCFFHFFCLLCGFKFSKTRKKTIVRSQWSHFAYVSLGLWLWPISGTFGKANPKCAQSHLRMVTCGPINWNIRFKFVTDFRNPTPNVTDFQNPTPHVTILTSEWSHLAL